MADSRAEVRKIQEKTDKTGASCSTGTRNKGLEHVPKAEVNLKEPPKSQSWNNLINKINNGVLAYSPKYKINIHVSTLI